MVLGGLKNELAKGITGRVDFGGHPASAGCKVLHP
jgi:hypothetical protein